MKQKLGKERIDKLRTKIIELLKDVPQGQRIKIDNDILDDLIFFKGKNKEGKVIKVPVWTGEFLRKIDLSEISFENAFFQDGYSLDSIDEEMDAEDISKFKSKNGGYIAPFVNENSTSIDFSYTNANIDFSKVYTPTIYDCNFEGVDLSKSNVECLTTIMDSNFKNTNITFNFNSKFFFYTDSDFSGNDFSNSNVDANAFYLDTIRHLGGSNFSNTGLNINYEEPDIPQEYYEACKELEKLEKLPKEEQSGEEFRLKRNQYEQIVGSFSEEVKFKEVFEGYINEGKFDGCYINGKKVLSKEERQVIAQEKKLEYENMQDELLSSVIDNIEQQTNSGRGIK